MGSGKIVREVEVAGAWELVGCGRWPQNDTQNLMKGISQQLWPETGHQFPKTWWRELQQRTQIQYDIGCLPKSSFPLHASRIKIGNHIYVDCLASRNAEQMAVGLGRALETP
jgi:hypothetical protein